MNSFKRFTDVSCGMGLASCFYSLYQDYLGQSAYIEVCRNHWVSGDITVPLVLFSLVLCIATLARNK